MKARRCPFFSNTNVPDEYGKYQKIQNEISCLTESSLADVVDLATANFTEIESETVFRTILHYTFIRPHKWEQYAKLWIDLQKKYKTVFNFVVALDVNPAFAKLIYEECLDLKEDFVTEEIVAKSLKQSFDDAVNFFNKKMTKEDIIRGYSKGSIEAAIKADDVDEFNHIANQEGFDITMQATLNRYETRTKLKRIDLLSFAAYYGSTKIFNLLIDKIEPNEITAKYAVRGMNMNIIKAIMDRDVSLQRCLKPAVQYHSQEVSDLIISTYKEWEGVQMVYENSFFFTLGTLYYADVLCVNVNEPSDFGKSIIFKAALHGDVAAAKILLNKKADVNSALFDDYPIHAACKTHSLEMVNLLLDNGADVEKCTIDQSTTLMFAVKSGVLPIVETIFDKCAKEDIDKVNEEGFTALHYATLNGFEDITDFLISKGADITKLTPKGANILQLALKSGNKKLVEKLMEEHKEFDINFRTIKGKTALHYAIKGCNFDLVKLVASKIDGKVSDNLANANPAIINAAGGTEEIFQWLLNKIDDEVEDVNINALSAQNGQTLLHICADMNFKDSIEKLLKRSADTSIKDNKENKAISIACTKGNLEIVKILAARMNEKMDDVPDDIVILACTSGNLELVKFVIDMFKDYEENIISAKNTRKANAINKASENDSLDIIKYLDSIGVNIDEKDEDGRNPLMNAVIAGSDDIAEFIISKGVDPNQKDKFGLTALHYAANHGRNSLVKLLINNKADPNIANEKNNYKAIHCACENGFKTIADYLLPLTEIDGKDTNLFLLAAKTGCISIMSKMLTLGYKINSTNEKKSTALHEAFENSCLLSVYFLKKKGAGEGYLNSDNAKPITLASDEIKRQYYGQPTQQKDNSTSQSQCCLLI